MKPVLFVTAERVDAANRLERLLVSFPRVLFASVVPAVDDPDLYRIMIGKPRGRPEVKHDAFCAIIDRYAPEFLGASFKYELVTLHGECHAGKEDHNVAAREASLPPLSPGGNG